MSIKFRTKLSSPKIDKFPKSLLSMKTTLNDNVLEKIESHFNILLIKEREETLNLLRLKLYEVVNVLKELYISSFSHKTSFYTYNKDQITKIEDIRDDLMKKIEEISFELYKNASFLEEIPQEYFPIDIKYTNNKKDILLKLYKKHEEVCLKLYQHFFAIDDRSKFWTLKDEEINLLEVIRNTISKQIFEFKKPTYKNPYYYTPSTFIHGN
jgi:hypothetical protein